MLIAIRFALTVAVLLAIFTRGVRLLPGWLGDFKCQTCPVIL